MADNWLSDAWEWLVPGEDDQGIFKNIFGSDETEYEDISSFDPNLIDDLLAEYGEGGLDTLLPTEEMDWMDDLGFSFGDWGADDYTQNAFQGTGTRETWGGDEDLTFLQRMGVGEDYDTPQWLKVIGDILGVGGSKGGKRQGILGLPQQILGGGQDGGGMGTLGKLLLANYLTKKDEGPAGIVPIGAEAYGGGDGGSPIDYRVMNLQPALMPGVAYANVGTQSPPPPPGMEHGGLGDVTLAKLEPGEFVVTKKAVDNVGAKNLYKMMKQWEGRG
jgi:hypothetical protein